jgi:hypothetical protein
MLTAQMIGTKAMGELNAARQTAATEAAKVLGSATASGVLSDTQKKEALDVLDGNATFETAVGIVDTLKQDFANRHDSYTNQIADIKGRMGGKSQGGGNAQQPTGKVLSMAQIQQAAKDHNVSVDEATRQAKAAGYTIQ